MKKMYKKPVTEEILVNTKLMDSSIGVSGGGTEQLNGGTGGKVTGSAPKRSGEVF